MKWVLIAKNECLIHRYDMSEPIMKCNIGDEVELISKCNEGKVYIKHINTGQVGYAMEYYFAVSRINN